MTEHEFFISLAYGISALVLLGLALASRRAQTAARREVDTLKTMRRTQRGEG